MADKLLKSIKFPTLPDRYVIGDSTLTEEGAAADAKAVGEALATKADTKGRYEDLIVGGAEQLMSDEYETDKEPYIFRPTGGSADVGNREYVDKIVGGTVAWNQLARLILPTKTLNGVTFTVGSDGTITANGTASGNARFPGFSAPFIVNHVYYSCGCPSGGSRQTYRLYSSYMNDKLDEGGGYVFKITTTSFPEASGEVFIVDGYTANNLVFRPQFFDLTAMFGTTIADYIYSLEQATAGAGVAWFKKLFPKSYYPYNAGELMSVKTSAHVTTGFNQWDEEWESGYYDVADGSKQASSAWARNKAYVPVVPNATYTFKADATASVGGVGYILYYSADKQFINSYTQMNSALFGSTGQQFTTPENAYYVAFYMNTAWQSVGICINLSDPTRNGEYEPCTKHTYPLDSSLTLRGTPKLVDGKLAFDGDVYLPSGEVQRRYGIVDLGTLNWAYDSNGVFFFAKIGATQTAYNYEAICSKYAKNTSTAPIDKTWQNNAYVGSFYNIIIKDTSYTDAASFKAAMSGVMLVYEVKTPTTETADGYEQYQICDPSGTEEFVTTGIVPVGHETRYPHDLKKKIETAPDSPSADGTYLMKRSGGKNTYMALPSTPSSNGSYVLTVTVSGGNATYSWTAKE